MKHLIEFFPNMKIKLTEESLQNIDIISIYKENLPKI